MTKEEWAEQAADCLVNIYGGLGELDRLEGHRAFVGDRALLALLTQHDPDELIIAFGIEMTSALLGYPSEIVVDGRPSPVSQESDPTCQAVRRAHLALVETTGDVWRRAFPANATEIVYASLTSCIREGRRRGECP